MRIFGRSVYFEGTREDFTEEGTSMLRSEDELELVRQWQGSGRVHQLRQSLVAGAGRAFVLSRSNAAGLEDRMSQARGGQR